MRAAGHYKLWVENNEVRNTGPTPFSVRLTLDGSVEDKHFDDCQELEEVMCFAFDIAESGRGLRRTGSGAGRG